MNHLLRILDKFCVWSFAIQFSKKRIFVSMGKKLQSQARQQLVSDFLLLLVDVLLVAHLEFVDRLLLFSPANPRQINLCLVN